MSFLGNIVNGIGKAIGSVGNAFTGGLFGLGESAINAYSQNKANKTNLEIAQMNNQYNERMMEKQMAYNTDMWNKENAYNTAASQVQRLKEAGLNPYMALSGSSSAGMATSANGVTAPTAQAANVQAYNSGGQITQAIMQGYQADLATARQKADIDALQQNMQLKTFETMSKLANERWDRMTKKQQYELNKSLLRYADGLNYYEYEQRKANVELTRRQTEGVIADNVSKRLINEQLPEKLKLELSDMAASIALKVAQRKLTSVTARNEWNKESQILAQTAGIKLDNKLKSATFDAAVELAIQQTLPSVGLYGENTGDWSASREYAKYPKK